MWIRAVQHKHRLDAILVEKTAQLEEQEAVDIQSDVELAQVIQLHDLVLEGRLLRLGITRIVSVAALRAANIHHSQDLFDVVELTLAAAFRVLELALGVLVERLQRCLVLIVDLLHDERVLRLPTQGDDQLALGSRLLRRPRLLEGRCCSRPTDRLTIFLHTATWSILLFLVGLESHRDGLLVVLELAALNQPTEDD